MNILLLNINLGTAHCYGGIETHSDILASVLADRGHNVIVGCWVEGTLVTTSEGKALPARRITIRNSGDLRAIFKLREICRRESISVILANNGREYWPAALAAKSAGSRVIFIRHQTDPIRFTTRHLINNCVDKVVAVSGAVRNAVLASGVHERKVEVIPNFVFLSRFTPEKIDRMAVRKGLGLRPSDRVVGYVGKLEEGKGIFDLLAAAGILRKSYPGLKLMFVGEGTKRETLLSSAERSSLSDMVILTGMRNDVQNMYAAMDVLVLPSTCDEAFGIALIEAMAMGKPVVGTTVGGIPEIITHGETGLLALPGNASALADSLARYLSDEAFARTVANAGRRRVLEVYSEKAAGDSFDRLISDIVNSPNFLAGSGRNRKERL